MQFTQLILSVQGTNVTFIPFDRGASGAFVYRQNGASLHANRLVVSTAVDDASSDKYSVQLNAPRVKPAEEGCCTIDSLLGTDLVKTELRFLATTSEADRKWQIDAHIAALQEYRETFEKRERLYS